MEWFARLEGGPGGVCDDTAGDDRQAVVEIVVLDGKEDAQAIGPRKRDCDADVNGFRWRGAEREEVGRHVERMRLREDKIREGSSAVHFRKSAIGQGDVRTFRRCSKAMPKGAARK